MPVGFMLETYDDIASISHDEHVDRSFAPPPLLIPEAENVVQVDVKQAATISLPLVDIPSH